MSDPDPAPRPEPKEDAPPDDGPGGPADMIRDDDVQPATPDQPRSAQVEAEQVPDEIEEPEDQDQDVADDEKNVEEISRRLNTLTGEQLQRVKDYERRNKNRETLVREIDRNIAAAS